MSQAIRIETERLILRAPQLSDFDHWAEFMASDRSRTIGGGDMDRTEAWKIFARIAGMWFLRGYGLFVCEQKSDGLPVASIGPWYPITWPEREIGWSVWSAKAEGTGLALEAARASLDYAFDALGWDTAVSYVDVTNTRSRALAERLGAAIDPNAASPDFSAVGATQTLVYRHPNPKVAS